MPTGSEAGLMAVCEEIFGALQGTLRYYLGARKRRLAFALCFALCQERGVRVRREGAGRGREGVLEPAAQSPGSSPGGELDFFRAGLVLRIGSHLGPESPRKRKPPG